MESIVITGASGYIGTHLLDELLRGPKLRIKMLSRSARKDLNGPGKGMELICGDLRAPRTLEGLFEPGCTVVNLVYLWSAGEVENLTVTENLLRTCKAAGVRRLIHCSTAAVVGRVPYDVITEETPCQPITEYGITKLKVEDAVREAADGFFDTAILRPTAVFGPRGNPLKKLAGDLMATRRLRNYLKSCLFDRRRMNLVHVDNVVASILFLMRWPEELRGEIYINSDDDSRHNNFADVERFLMKEFEVADYMLPRVPIPPIFLSFLLRCLRRNNINPCCNYSAMKLLKLGFVRPVTFEQGLADYASWYRMSYGGTQHNAHHS